MSPLSSYALQTLLTLALVAAVAFLISRVAKRGGMGRNVGPAELVARLPLEARRSVYLVRVSDKVLVLGASEAGVNLLLTLDHSKVPAAPEAQLSFAARMLQSQIPGRYSARAAAEAVALGSDTAVERNEG